MNPQARIAFVGQLSDGITGEAIRKSLASSSRAPSLSSLTAERLVAAATCLLGADPAVVGAPSTRDGRVRLRILDAMRRCLRDAEPAVATRIKNIRMNAERHPRLWDLLAEVCASAASGEYAAGNQHRSLVDVDNRIEQYLESGPDMPDVWADAWQRRAALLGLEPEGAP